MQDAALQAFIMAPSLAVPLYPAQYSAEDLAAAAAQVPLNYVPVPEVGPSTYGQTFNDFRMPAQVNNGQVLNDFQLEPHFPQPQPSVDMGFYLNQDNLPTEEDLEHIRNVMRKEARELGEALEYPK